MPNDDYPFDYGNAPANGQLPASPGSTAPQPRIVQDAPTVQMRRPAAPQQNPPPRSLWRIHSAGSSRTRFPYRRTTPIPTTPRRQNPIAKLVNHPDGKYLSSLRPRSLVAVHPRSAGLRAFFAWAFLSLAR